ncbi:MAG: zinc-binding dehydrogenase, partial [Sciscionella sp.]
ASVSATGLRARPLAEKAAVVADVRERLWPLIARGTVKPVVHQELPMADAAQAHRMLDEGGVFGKIILRAG